MKREHTTALVGMTLLVVSTTASALAPEEQIAQSHQRAIAAPFAFPFGGIRGSTSSFVKLVLPRRVSVAFPRAWRVLGPDELQVIDTAAGAMADISGIGSDDTAERVLLAANSMPRTTYATVRITSSAPTFPEKDRRGMLTLVGRSSNNSTEIASFAKNIHSQTEAMLAAGGMRVTRFYGVRIDKISGHPAIITEYSRTGLKGDVFVQINHVLAPTHDVQVNLSYRASEGPIWMLVLGRIRHSINIS